MWVGFLGAHGIEATHWSTIGDASAPGSRILDYAASNGFVVFTRDLDFGMLLASSKAHGPSVIQMRTQDVFPSAIGELVLRAIVAVGDHLDASAIVTVDLAQNRIRLLPI